MHTDLQTGRRSFLGGSLAVAGSALTTGLFPGTCDAQSNARSESEDGPEPTLGALYNTSVLATGLKGEAADRLALRRLVDSWAHCADRRLAEQQANLFMPDGVLLNYEGEPSTHEPHSTLRGRAAIQTALAVLNTFTVTLHLNGQSEVAMQRERAVGETYCLVHQFKMMDGKRNCQTLGIRYYDKFLRQENKWFFEERKLIIDWSDTRVSVP